MAFWIPMAIGAGVGLLKNQSEREQTKKMNQAAAAQTEYSALTGMGPGQIQKMKSPWEDMLQGAAAGASFGQQFGGAGGGGAGAGAAPPVTMAGVQGSGIQQKQNPWKSMGGGMYA